MGSRKQTSTSTERAMAEEAARGGLSSVGNIAVRVAGMVPTRVDMRFAGTPQQQLGISLGTILARVHPSHGGGDRGQVGRGRADGSRPVAGAAGPAARRDGVRPVAALGMVRFAGMPTVNADVLTAQPGRELPSMLRIQVGPVAWELFTDAAAYSSMLSAWRIAAGLLAAPCGETPQV